ncbi:MAG: hypothetical protein M1815_001947 [Lichina confinis]|nr:MAG: hypothetical protein M1815_001947 [Lichina confinis]
MAEFDQKKAYVQKDDKTYFDDGREQELLRFIYSHPSLESLRGSPSKIVGAIDEYGRNKAFMMNVGEHKGKIVTDLIGEIKPQVMVELGGYVGYSALLFGDAVRRAGGKQYLSLERDPLFAAVITSLVDLAGLRDVVQVVVGSSGGSLKRLHQEGTLKRIDLMFLDHYKPAYTEDLKLCEELGLVGPGSVLAADNVVLPGNPPYLEYVRSSVDEKRRKFGDSACTDASTEDFLERSKKQYEKSHGPTAVDAEANGNPNLVYESKLVESFEPTGQKDGVEVSRCVGEEKPKE